MNGNTNNERIYRRYKTEQKKRKNGGDKNGELNAELEDEKEHGLINQAVVNHLTKFIVDSLERDKVACKDKRRDNTSSLERVTNSLKRRLTLDIHHSSKGNKGSSSDDHEGFGSEGEITKLCSKALAKLLTSNIDHPQQQPEVSVEGPNIDERLLKLVQNQRDMYLIGTSIKFPTNSMMYSGSSTSRRFAQDARFQNFSGTNNFPIIDSNALGHLKPIVFNYLSSDMCYQQLKSVVHYQLLPDQPAEISMTNIIVNTLPLAQPTLNNIVKNSLIQFLDRTDIRQMAKQRIINTTSAVAGKEPPTLLAIPGESDTVKADSVDKSQEQQAESSSNVPSSSLDGTTDSATSKDTTPSQPSPAPKLVPPPKTKRRSTEEDEDEIEPPEFI